MSASQPETSRPASVTAKPRSLRLPARYTPLLFAFYMSGIMALLMTLLITALNRGFSSDYLSQVWQAYQVAMPCAFSAILLVRPLVMRLVKYSIQPE